MHDINLPIGTPNYPDLKTYCEKVPLEKYDIFLIFSNYRFTENNRLLAEKIKSLSKPFFFVRTHIDVNYNSGKRDEGDQFDPIKMEEDIRTSCLEYLEEFAACNEDIYLICNHEPFKWDFPRLTQAILKVLPVLQKESLALSLTNLSKDLIREKVGVLGGIYLPHINITLKQKSQSAAFP